MAEPYLGQILLVGFNFNPRGYANCDGQLMQIASNSALFSLLGTIYGGDGRTTFALPDLRGRVPIHVGQGPGLPNFRQGQKGGAVTETLDLNELPAHTHSQPDISGATGRMRATANPPSTDNAMGNTLAMVPGYSSDAPSVDMAPNTVSIDTISLEPTNATGGGNAHNNMQPYLTMRYVIAIQGQFPSRN